MQAFGDLGGGNDMVKSNVPCKLDLAFEFIPLLPTSLGPLGVSSVACRTPGVLREVVHHVLDGGGTLS